MYGRWFDVNARDENIESVAFTLDWSGDMLNEIIALKLALELQCICFFL